MHAIVSRFGLLMILGVLVGCGSAKPLPAPTTVPVSGKILLASGSPLTGGRVMFKPKDPAMQEATSDVGPDGSFALTTFTNKDGALPGEYVVVVELVSYKSGSAQPVRAQVSRKYLDAKTSDLVVTVKVGEGPMTLQMK